MLKAYNTRLIDEETGDMAFKPTDSLFDYITDHMLVNYILGTTSAWKVYTGKTALFSLSYRSPLLQEPTHLRRKYQADWPTKV